MRATHKKGVFFTTLLILKLIMFSMELLLGVNGESFSHFTIYHDEGPLDGVFNTVTIETASRFSPDSSYGFCFRCIVITVCICRITKRVETQLNACVRDGSNFVFKILRI